VAEEVASSANDASNVSCHEAESASEIEKVCDIPIVQSPTNQEDATICNSENIVAETPLESVQTATLGRKPKDKNVELNGQTNHLVGNVETITTNDTMEIRREALTNHKALSKTDAVKNNDELTGANARHELLESNGIDTDLLNNCVKHPKETMINDGTFYETEDFADLITKARSVSPRINTVTEKPKKYNSKKGGKFVREPTPGPDLNDLDLENGKLVQQLMVVELSDDVRTIADREGDIVKNKLSENNRKAVNDQEAISETRSNVDNAKVTSQDAIMSSNEDSGFESQTRLSEYPITTAVTEWLRRVNSPDLFVTSGSASSDSETDEDEEMDAKPPKNLQGNPMPALSANSGVDNVTLLSHAASCGEFAKTNSNDDTKIDQVEADAMLTSTGRRKKDAKVMKRKSKTKKIEKRNRNVDEKTTQSHLVSSLVSCDRLKDFVTAVRLRNIPKHNVADVCEFTQKDSVAGMRVALSSRINTKRVNARRAKIERRINGNPIENIDIKMRRIDDSSGERNKEINGDSTVSVRTFEKGEIIVSENGKLLPTSAYEPVPLDGHDPDGARNAAHVDVINENVEARENSRNSSENGSMMMSSISIEEPDVLECWEAETIEPVITPKRLLQTPGILCDGEAAEEDNLKIEQATMEHVQKYYRLARDGVMSGEPSEPNTSVISSRSRTVPNHSSERKPMEHFCSEEIPVFVPAKNRIVISADETIPVDEAFEVYESCYTEKSPFLAYDPKIFKQRPLHGQNGEDPIPCRAVCCNLQ